MHVQFNLPTIEQDEIDEVIATLRSGWLTTGPRTAQFEAEFKAYVESPYALAVNSATAGLHLALAALGIGPGNEVITTPLTFCSTVNSILHLGATPVLADIGPNGNIDPASIAERIGPRTRAILPVHLAGLPCDMTAIWALARRHGLSVVEDAAHAIGSRFQGHPIGAGHPEMDSRSDAVAYSFYATKNLTTGEGGMVTTHDAAVEERMKVLCLHGISRDAWNRYSDRGSWQYDVIECGFKYNLSDIQAAIGIHQLRKQERFVAARTEIAGVYNEAFKDLDELELPPDDPSCRHAWHLYAIRLRLDQLTITRAEFIQELRERNIGASVHFIPIQTFTFFRDHASDPRNDCPNALRLYPRLVSLPLYPAMSRAQVDHVTGAVKEILAKSRKHAVVTASAPKACPA